MKQLKIIFILAILLRLLLSATTYHSDISAFSLSSWFINSGHILDLYDYLSSAQNPFINKYPVDFFIYPPSIYFFHGLFGLISYLLLPSLQYQLLTDPSQVLGSGGLFIYLLLLKLPYLFFDLGSGFFIFNLFNDQQKKIRALILWLFNPITLYGTYMIGQFDIIPTFFVLWVIYLMQKSSLQLNVQRLSLMSVLLGIGACFKIYPLFFLIPLAALNPKFIVRIWIVILGLLVYVLPLLPFISSPGFKASALLANHTQKSLYAQIPISGGESLLLFVVVIAFMYLMTLTTKVTGNNFWKYCFLILLTFFVFTHYHPQWFIWTSPFLIISLLVSNFKTRYALTLSTISFFGLLWFFDGGLTIGLFAPLNPNLYLSKGIWELWGITIDSTYYRSIFQSLLASAAIFYGYEHFFRKDDE